MRIAIPDDYQKVIKTLNCYKLISDHDVTIIHYYYSDLNELAKQLNNPEALVLTRTRTPVNEEFLDKLPALKVISQTGKNSGHIDEEACLRRGIKILESKGNPIATAELTWNLIMSGLRELPQAIEGMKKGLWQVNLGRRVKEKKIGIWGYGKIGQRVANYAKAFEAEVYVWGSEASMSSAIQNGFKVFKTKEEFFSECDVITIHLRLNSHTREIIRKEDLNKMKPDSLFVNTARSGLIERGALIDSLRNGRPGFAALDVFDQEPIFNFDHALLQMQNVICTPHLGYVEREGYELYFEQAFSNLINHYNS